MSMNPEAEILNKLKDASLWFTIITLISNLGIIAYTGALEVSVSPLSSSVSISSAFNDAEFLAIISLVLLLIKGRPLIGSAIEMAKYSGKSSGRGIGAIVYLAIGYILQFILGILLLILFLYYEGVINLSSGTARSLTYVSLGVTGSLFEYGGVVLLTFVGYLLLALGIYEIATSYNDRLLKIGAGIIAIPILGTAGWVLVYMATFSLLRKMGVPLVQPTYIYPQPIAQQQSLPYQIGSGMLRYDGSAFFSIYSPTQGTQIANAVIQELGISTTDIQPRILSSGTNNIFARFSPINTSTPTGTYTIILTFSNGQSTLVKVNLS